VSRGWYRRCLTRHQPPGCPRHPVAPPATPPAPPTRVPQLVVLQQQQPPTPRWSPRGAQQLSQVGAEGGGGVAPAAAATEREGAGRTTGRWEHRLAANSRTHCDWAVMCVSTRFWQRRWEPASAPAHARRPHIQPVRVRHELRKAAAPAAGGPKQQGATDAGAGGRLRQRAVERGHALKGLQRCVWQRDRQGNSSELPAKHSSQSSRTQTASPKHTAHLWHHHHPQLLDLPLKGPQRAGDKVAKRARGPACQGDGRTWGRDGGG
jgi:hypothetical protein